MGRQKGVGRVGFDLPRLADAVFPVEVFIEGGVGGDEAHGAAVGRDAADAGSAPHACPGNNSNDHRSPPGEKEESTGFTAGTDKRLES